MSSSADQPALFDIETDDKGTTVRSSVPDQPQMRTSANDLSAAALEYLPQVINSTGVEDYQAFLEENLSYNSLNSRKRYVRNLISHYYPANDVRTPLAELLSHQPAAGALKAVLSYETARAEPAVQLVAEDAIWPAVPLG